MGVVVSVLCVRNKACDCQFWHARLIHWLLYTTASYTVVQQSTGMLTLPHSIKKKACDCQFTHSLVVVSKQQFALVLSAASNTSHWNTHHFTPLAFPWVYTNRPRTIKPFSPCSWTLTTDAKVKHCGFGSVVYYASQRGRRNAVVGSVSM